MEQRETGLPQFQELTNRQKVNLLRKNFKHVDPSQFSEKSLTTNKNVLWINLLYPGDAPWSEISKRRIPPQRGQFSGFVKDKEGKTSGVIVDFTATTHVTGVQYAQFPIPALEVSKDEEVFVDCRKLAAASGVQSILPNFFVEKTLEER